MGASSKRKARAAVRYYPLLLDVKRRRCVIFGGGKVAERKARRLISFGAEVRIYSPLLTEGLQELADSGEITYVRRKYAPALLKNAYLVFAATSSKRINRAIAQESTRRGIPVNCVTSARDSTFILPSIVELENCLISISTGGKSPSLAKKLRQRLTRYMAQLLMEREGD